MDDENIDKLINMLRDTNQILPLRLLAIEQIAEKSEGDKGVQVLIEALSDDEQEIRAYAAEMLGKMKSKRALFPLIDALQDLSHEVRISALKSLALLNDEQAIEAIAKRIKDKHDKVRYEAVKALATFDSKEIIRPLFDALVDENEAVRNETQRILIGLRLSEKISEEIMIPILQHNDPFTRNIATQFITFRLIGDAIPLLTKQASDSDWEVRLSALEQLNKIVSTKNDKISDQVLECCLQRLDDDNEKIRIETIDILREIKDERAVDKLITVSTKDPDERVRFEAIDAITEIRRAKRLD